MIWKKICKNCNRFFETFVRNKRYCSENCYPHKFRDEVICAYCEKRFRTCLYKRHKYLKRVCCSRSCSAKLRIKEGKNRVYVRGEKSWNWKGGKYLQGGYVVIYSPNHPSVQHYDSWGKRYVREHRLVMEEYLKRYLVSNEEVHHLNGIKNDNRIENLELVVKKFHYGQLKCPKCSFGFWVK